MSESSADAQDPVEQDSLAEASYRLFHITRYRYPQRVTRSFGTFHQRPRSTSWQQVHDSRVTVGPEPAQQHLRVDAWGNTSTWFVVEADHTELEVRADSCVTVQSPEPAAAALSRPWEECRPVASEAVAAWRQRDFTLASPLVDLEEAARDYAAASLLPGRPIGEAVDDLNHRIHADFEYRSGSTTVTTRVAQVLEQRSGVCQDFAQLMIACLRSHGLAARYVSGYLATTPPPGKPRLVGADASHAWVSTWIPGVLPGIGGDGDWLMHDPTNDRRCDTSHVTVAWGRDYGDVAPLRGIIYSEGRGSKLTVSVDVAPVSRAVAESGLPAPS